MAMNKKEFKRVAFSGAVATVKATLQSQATATANAIIQTAPKGETVNDFITRSQVAVKNLQDALDDFVKAAAFKEDLDRDNN